eukprot:1161764-Pelagomonas_calceolata.AAC.1
MLDKVNFLDPKFTGACGSDICLWIGGVLLASGLLNPCLSRLERARSAVGRRRLGLLCWVPNSCMCWWKFVFIAEASTGRASPGFSYVDLLSLLVSVAIKLRQAIPVVSALAGTTNVHVKVGGFQINKLQASGVVAYLTACAFNVGTGSSADA